MNTDKIKQLEIKTTMDLYKLIQRRKEHLPKMALVLAKCLKATEN